MNGKPVYPVFLYAVCQRQKGMFLVWKKKGISRHKRKTKDNNQPIKHPQNKLCICYGFDYIDTLTKNIYAPKPKEK